MLGSQVWQAMYDIFIREGWAITLCAFVYVLLSVRVFKHHLLIALVIPFLISFTLHTIRFASTNNIDVIKYLSDILYDYLAPIGAFRLVVIFEAYFNTHKRQ